MITEDFVSFETVNPLEKQGEPKWSEEDEKMLNRLIGVLDGTNKEDYHEGWEDIFLPWLKSIRPQKQWKPTEEQMRALKYACDEHWEPDGLHPLYTLYEQIRKNMKEVFLPKDYDTQNSSCNEEEKLKWKPNMAQINALYAAIKQIDKGNADVLKGLYKKLIQL